MFQLSPEDTSVGREPRLTAARGLVDLGLACVIGRRMPIQKLGNTL